mmetsp:Transcript_54154/g.144281  ORF Transcript_54154/g.144281 Transcript_54154/m.144281 type:complete len:173 (+) Transcript_54154:318-836(+)
MSISDAVRVLGTRQMPQELLEAVSELPVRGTPVASLLAVLPPRRERNVTAGSVTAVESQGRTAAGSQLSEKPKINEVLVRIFKIINGMIVEDQNKLVIKVFECLKQSKSFASEYRTNRMNFFSESYKLQQAVSKEKAGQVEQSEADGRLRLVSGIWRALGGCQRVESRASRN